MTPELVIALALATSILVIIPGPNVALIVANTLAYGLRFGALTVLGTTCGILIQLIVVVSGFAILLELAAAAFVWIKWLGVLYLFWLGATAWRRGVGDLETTHASSRPAREVFWQGVMLATINPKTLLFISAFLPQFVLPGAGIGGLSLAALVYLTVAFVGDMGWAATSRLARPGVQKLGRYRHRLTGSFFIASALGLAVAGTGRKLGD